METLLQDVRFTIRNLLKRPGFTAVVVVTLAAGIGGTVTMFSTMNAVYLKPLPYDEPDQLAFVSGKSNYGNDGFVSSLDYFDYREQNDVFESMASIRGFGLQVTVSGDGIPERVTERTVSTELFSTLGVAPALGRDFVRAEEETGADRVVLLSDGFWRRGFGGVPDVVGGTMTIDQQAHTIVGVMPRGFDFPEGADIWLPMRRDSPFTGSRGPKNWFGVGRLKPEVTLEQAQQQVDVIGARLAEAYPETNTDRGWHLSALHDRLTGQARPTLLLFTGAVGLLLVIACANVAGLLLARGVSRSGELAVRSALGASRSRLVRQLLTESLLLAISGGAVGLILSSGLAGVVKQIVPASVPGIRDLGADGSVLVIAIAVSALTGLIVGLIPALRITRDDTAGQLSSARRVSDNGVTARLRGALVVGQVALSLILLVGAGLLMRSFLRLQAVDPGFNFSSLLTVEIPLPRDDYDSNEESSRFYSAFIEGLEAQSGVVAVAGISRLPIASPGGDYTVYPEELPPGDASERGSVVVRTVTPGYFETMGIPLLAGRGLGEQDDQDAPAVAVVDEALVRRYYTDQNPIGKNLMFGRRRPVAVRIIGVVGDVLSYGLTSGPRPHMYFPPNQRPERTMSVMIRTTANPLTIVPVLRDLVHELDPNVPVAKIATMNQVISNSIAQPRTNMLFLGAFATVALLLAALGLYGVLAFLVTQRSQEIGVRIALGATHVNVLRLVLLRGFKLVGTGLILGISGAFGAIRFIRSLLFEVGSTDLLTFVTVSVLLVFVGIAACAIPAWRAMRVDPITALRFE
jgi:putative ABC transport system permease protein